MMCSNPHHEPREAETYATTRTKDGRQRSMPLCEHCTQIVIALARTQGSVQVIETFNPEAFTDNRS